MTNSTELDEIKKIDIILATIRQCYIFNDMMDSDEDDDGSGPGFDVIQSKLMDVLHIQANYVLFNSKLVGKDEVSDESIPK